MSKINITVNAKLNFDKDFEKIVEKAAIEKGEQDGIDIDCPKCGKRVHLLFSGDTCKFCGLSINYSIKPKV